VAFQAEDILNTKAGWKALTGTTDFGLITTLAFAAPASTEVDPDVPNPNRLAFDLFVDRILDFVGAYFVKLGGRVDALVFAGGIGERGAAVRKVVGRAVRCLGFAEVDPGKNEQVGVEGQGKVVDIGVEGGVDEGRKFLVCKTDEQVGRLLANSVRCAF
jgi:acetate kinase